MPDRRRRTAFRLPPAERVPMMLRERQSSSPGSSSSSGSSGSSSSDSSGSSGSSKPQDDNPFAAPPENRPDQPWQPRHPAQTGGGNGNDGNDGDDKSGDSGDRPAWGSQWSNQQPGRQNGGFGSRPGSTGPGGQGGQGGGKGGPDGGSGGMRWDPTDPAQRRARYAVLGGMWAFFFALFDFPEIALLLGALSVYWSISALRAKPKSPSSSTHATAEDVAGITRPTVTGDATGAAPGDGAAPGTGRVGYGRPQTTAAVSGLVTALLALSIVATTFTVQLVYRDYYTCVNDALTKSGALACNDLLPEPLEPFFGVKK
ncbi:hypothetical protein ACFT7S_25950 [Streptomyces sp. NPDC057136]|uniref:hypothetical protein n=1 Tax=Streptomyces sp. NPDC057136 TaxID=3346029 RepID=UPI0036443A45